MTLILFRELPRVSLVEQQLELQFRDRLLDDEVDELPHLVDEVSLELFGIIKRDTFYWALPDPLRNQYSRHEWELHFDVLGHHRRNPNAFWEDFGLDLCCEQGNRLHCLEVFGRQLICAVQGLHPRASLRNHRSSDRDAA